MQGSIPRRGKGFFSSPKCLRLALGPVQPPVQWVLGVCFPEDIVAVARS